MSISDARTGTVVLRGARLGTEVYLIDAGFRLQAGALELLERSGVPPGVYKARFQLGSEVKDELFELAPGGRQELKQELALDSISPLPWASLLGAPPVSFQELWEATAALRPGAGEGVLTVLVRGGAAAQSMGQVVELSAPAGPRPPPLRWARRSGHPVGTACLRAGTYVLAVTDEGGARLCRSVPVAPGQQTVVTLHVSAEVPKGNRLVAALLRSTMLMSTHPMSGQEEELLRQDVAQQALDRSRTLAGSGVPDRPLSPLALLLSTHGLLQDKRAHMTHPLEPVRLQGDEQRAVEEAYQRLKESELAGLADVAVLGLVVGREVGDIELSTPPLLISTWRTLVSETLAGFDRLQGGAAALERAERLVSTSLWLAWVDRAPPRRARASGGSLNATALEFLESELRPDAGRMPGWVGARDLGNLAKESQQTIARGLQLPVPLVLRLVKNLEDERARTRDARAARRLQALKDPRVRVCLVALPDGVRVDPTRGQPIDFDRVMEELADPAAASAGLIAVRAPPVGVDSEELQEAIARADMLLADATFADPTVMAIAGAWLARRPRGPLVQLQAEGRPAAARAGNAPRLTYAAAFGAGLTFLRPQAVRRALSSAARVAPRPSQAHWREALARTEERRLEIQLLAAKHRPHYRWDALDREKEEIRRQLRRALPPRSLRGERAQVQLDAFFLFRAFQDWSGMVGVAGVMSGPLRSTPVVREQLALALKWSTLPRNLERAVGQLRAVVDELGPNGETCGLLGSLCKKRWRQTVPTTSQEAQHWLEQAIHWYRTGLDGSPLDPYPGVNLLTLLAARGTPEAMVEHARVLPQVELAASKRLRQRPNYWDLASMAEIAANRCDERACEWYLRLALAAPHEGWQRATTADNFELLLGSELSQKMPWLNGLVATALPAPTAKGTVTRPKSEEPP